jgi:predicted PurR-regulated permease PerM
MTTPASASSPRWGSTTKTVVGLTIAGIVLGLLVYFRSMIGPVLLSVILAYLFHPVAARLCKWTRLSWRLVVTIIYLILLVMVIGTFTLSGLALVQEVQNLIVVVQDFIQTDLPKLTENLSGQVYNFGPLKLDMSQFDLNAVSQQLIGTLQPVLSSVGNLFGELATRTLTTIGLTLFILLVSYFLLSGAGRMPDPLDYIRLPGYENDVRRMGQELGRIWSAFLRGQLIIISLTVVVYTILMAGMGVKNWAFAIAVLAGLARLVPYVGPFVTWTITVIVTVVQGENYFGLSPVGYAILVVVVALVVDQIFDNIVSPLIFGQVLSIHPALLLIGAYVAARSLGLVGLFLTAPTIASLKMVGGYTVNKMLDQDPWKELDERYRAKKPPQESRLTKILRGWWQRTRQRSKINARK